MFPLRKSCRSVARSRYKPGAPCFLVVQNAVTNRRFSCFFLDAALQNAVTNRAPNGSQANFGIFCVFSKTPLQTRYFLAFFLAIFDLFLWRFLAKTCLKTGNLFAFGNPAILGVAFCKIIQNAVTNRGILCVLLVRNDSKRRYKPWNFVNFPVQNASRNPYKPCNFLHFARGKWIKTPSKTVQLCISRRVLMFRYAVTNHGILSWIFTRGM